LPLQLLSPAAATLSFDSVDVGYGSQAELVFALAISAFVPVAEATNPLVIGALHLIKQVDVVTPRVYVTGSIQNALA
jgi:hypothetical protein